MICPFCEQGRIIRASVKKNGKTIFICEECDTVWVDNISQDTVTNFDGFMSQYGISPALWEHIEIEDGKN